ncbi:hypothetical protein IJ114_03345 [Candidatus Saccharibacteria bacterium]|nr:hypothetical protein [Candidatus Saccharibacteria bacterium]
MSTKKGKEKTIRQNRALTAIIFGFVIAAMPVFILLSFYAYSLVFIGNDSASVAGGIAILVAMVASLGFVIFNRH